MPDVMVAPAIATLMRGAVDYAGLFPPASRDMIGAVAEYAEYRRSGDAWMLGRFVVTADRLGELTDAARSQLAADRWSVSVLIGDDVAGGVSAMRAFEGATAGAAVVAAIELRASSAGDVARVLAAAPAHPERYVELALGAELEPLVAAVARGGARAKVRTGGVVASAVPRPAALLAFIRSCVSHGVSFKATAGLHHPLRDVYPLTYAPNAPMETLFGFLNVMLATAFVTAGIDDAAALALLEERDPASFDFDDGVSWRGHRLTSEQLVSGRQSIVSFGSCSFREPVDELRALPFRSGHP